MHGQCQIVPECLTSTRLLFAVNIGDSSLTNLPVNEDPSINLKC